MKVDVLKGEQWGELKEILIFGYGKQGRKVLNTLKRDFKIIAIIENDTKKTGTEVRGIPIISFCDAVELLKKYKVIITAAEFFYRQIKKQLQEIGLAENRDFVMYQPFIMEWYYKYRQKIYLLKTDFIVTSLCSLKCKNCALFMPYWHNKISFSVEQIKSDADHYFRCVDFVLDMNIIGGEPFLYKDLDEVLLWIAEHYRQKIGHLGMITNGTIIPKESTLAIIQKYNIVISISDYSDKVGYKTQVDKLCEILENHQIEYVRNSEIQWFDFGFPEPKYCYEGESARIHMEQCNTICHIVNDGKVYYCSSAWAAYMAGLYQDAFKGDVGYVDLKEINENNLAERKRILDCCCGNMGDKYIDFCRVCGGYGADNKNEVETAVQLDR